MIKKNITYVDYDGNTQTEEAHFHISKSDLMDNIDIRKEFEYMEALLKEAAAEERDLEDEEIQKMINLVRRLVDMAYGIRSHDGRRFMKSEEHLRNFKETPMYDAVVWNMFQDTNQAVEFMTNLLPKDLMDQARAAQEGDQLPKPQDHLSKQVPKKEDGSSAFQPVEFNEGVVEGVEPVVSVQEFLETPEEKRARLQKELAELEG